MISLLLVTIWIHKSYKIAQIVNVYVVKMINWQCAWICQRWWDSFWGCNVLLPAIGGRHGDFFLFINRNVMLWKQGGRTRALNKF